MRALLFALAAVFCVSCGVKGPPIPPIPAPELSEKTITAPSPGPVAP